MIRLFRSGLNLFSGVLSSAIFITLFVELIFMMLGSSLSIFKSIHYYLFLFLFFDIIFRTAIRPSRRFGYLRLALGYLSLAPILYVYQIQIFPFEINMGIEQILLLIIGMTRIHHLSYLFEPLRSNPTQSFVGGFLLLIFIGTLFLLNPTSYNQQISFVDAMFTAASAVCVTGLTVFLSKDKIQLFDRYVN